MTFAVLHYLHRDVEIDHLQAELENIVSWSSKYHGPSINPRKNKANNELLNQDCSKNAYPTIWAFRDPEGPIILAATVPNIQY